MASTLIHSDDGDDDQGELKPPLACQSCRASKVRCQQPNPDLPCARCKKASRPCIPSSAVVKRQRHPRNAVAELETKIDALTNSLQMQVDGSAAHPDLENAQGGSNSGKAPGAFPAPGSLTNHAGTSEGLQPAFPPDLPSAIAAPLTPPWSGSSLGSVFRLAPAPACQSIAPY
jgi:hypothetical protein